MKKYTFLLLLFCCFSAQNLDAQINESDAARLQVRTSLTGNYQSGNVEFLAIRGKLDLLYALSPKWIFKSQNNSLYQAFYSRKADNDVFSRNYLYFKPFNRVYPYAIGYVSANFRRKIDLRYFAGAGVTWQVVRKPQQVIKLSTNATYESSRFNGSQYNEIKYNGDRTINVWRGTLYLAGTHTILNKKVRLWYDAFWQQAFDDAANYRTQYDVGLEMPVWRGLNITALFTATHENVVLENIRQDDKLLSFGLSYFLKINAK